MNIRDYLKASTALPAKKCFIDHASNWMNPKTAALGACPPREGQKGSLSGSPGTQGDPGFRIFRFRMQNSSAQTKVCGRDDVFFYFGPKFEHVRTL